MHVIELVQSFIRQHQLLQQDDRCVLVALSGGADSMALLRILHALGYPVHALHCNFHLRGAESDRDHQFVTQQCEQHGIPLSVKHFNTRDYATHQGISIEMAARDLRYNWFHHMRNECDAQAIAVAHHQDDQAETLLLHLIRGAGMQGLMGMLPRHDMVVRPLLCLSRAQVEEYLHTLQQPFITDSTNLERDAVRNRLRLDIIPALQQINPQVTQKLVQTTQYMQQSMPLLTQAMDDALQGMGATPDTLDVDRFVQAGANPSILHHWLRHAGFNHTQLQQIMQNVWSQPQQAHGALFTTPTHELLRHHQQLILARRTQASAQCLTLVVPGVTLLPGQGSIHTTICHDTHGLPRTPQYAWIDADKLPTGPLQLRPVRPGDRFTPFGMKGSKLVSDLLTQQGLNHFQRRSQLVLTTSQDRIVWVVGLRSDNHYRVDANTHRILLMEKSPIPNSL